jgi:hypothetical protein
MLSWVRIGGRLARRAGIACLLGATLNAAAQTPGAAPARAEAKQSTADHSMFTELQKPF